jgi:hypothetical protein
MREMHLYEKLPLFSTGLVLALAVIGISGFLFLKPQQATRFLKKFPRDHMAGQILLGIGMVWFWLLIAPDTLGIFSSLSMDLGEFNGAKPFLRIAVPVTFILVCVSVKEFLAVRALGLLGLMISAPLLEAAFLKDPATRLLIPILAYGLIIKSMFWIGMPYTFRDAADWVTASASRLRAWATGGLLYGLAILICALLFWRGH